MMDVEDTRSTGGKTKKRKSSPDAKTAKKNTPLKRKESNPNNEDGPKPKKVRTFDEIWTNRVLVKQAELKLAEGPLENLVSKFQDFAELLSAKGQKVQCDTVYNEFLKELALYEHRMSKAKVAVETMACETKTFEENENFIQNKIVKTQEQIEKLKVELEHERMEKAHREECVALAKLVNQLPTRTETKRRIEKQTVELQKLKNEKNLIEKEMTAKRKQFALFNYSLSQLQQEILG